MRFITSGALIDSSGVRSTNRDTKKKQKLYCNFDHRLTIADAGVSLVTWKTRDALIRAERVFTLLVGAGVGIQALIDVWSQ